MFIKPEKEEENFDLIKSIKDYDYQTYTTLCRIDTKTLTNPYLYCRYVTNNNPFLKIGPLKLELYSIDPYLVMYHDVLYDSEIEQLKMVSHSNVSLHRGIE